MKYLLSVRSSRVGGAVVPARLERGNELGSVDSLRLKSSVIVMIHGYNVDYDKGRQSLLALADLLALSETEAPVGFLWPGDSPAGFLSYPFEHRDALDSAAELSKFILDCVPSDTDVHFVAHSLGCRVAMETVCRLRAAGREVGHVCLLAAAVDDDSLCDPDVYVAALAGARRVAVLSSKSDGVLKVAYPAGDLLEAFFFASQNAARALGYHGPRAHEDSGTLVPPGVVDQRIPRSLEVGHGDYFPGPKTEPKHHDAANFARAVLRGDPMPRYVTS